MSGSQSDAEAPSPGTSDKTGDRVLIERSLSGDRAAFGELVERHQKRVYSLAYGIVRNRDDAWDVAQEAFVKAYRNLDRYDGSAAFFTWIYRITYNIAIDHLRAKGRRKDEAVQGRPGLQRAMQNEAETALDRDPQASTKRAELSRVLHEALAKLSDKHRAIIVLREVEELSYEEIAQVLGVAKGTVMSRLYHARRNLQALLSPYVESGDPVPDSLELAIQPGG